MCVCVYYVDDAELVAVGFGVICSCGLKVIVVTVWRVVK